jgi:Zn-dependent protease with chaperone function
LKDRSTVKPEHHRFNWDQVIPANAFHASRTIRGSLKAEAGSLRFESDAGAVSLPIEGLEVKLGGNNREQLFLSHPAAPDWNIYASELSLLQHPALKDRADVRQQTSLLKRQRSGWSKLALAGMILAGLFLGLILLIVSQKDRMVRFGAEQIPVEWEENFGDKMFEQIRSQGKLLDDSAKLAELQKIVEALSRPVQPYPFKIHILQDTNINAFAIPGGHVVVHTGLLAAAGRAEEIAGVLAHEFAHVTERHGFRKVIESAGLSLGLQALMGDATGLLGALGNSSEMLLRQKFSRNFEREADDVGWETLVAARVDPSGLKDFFERLRQIESSSAQPLALLNSHPATADRIKRLEAKLRTVKGGFTNLNVRMETLKRGL